MIFIYDDTLVSIVDTLCVKTMLIRHTSVGVDIPVIGSSAFSTYLPTTSIMTGPKSPDGMSGASFS